jgi:RNA polymerase sigma-70 factor, ECF subfamily
MPTDAEWVERLASGDEQALAAVYDRYQGRIYRFAMQMTGNTTLSQDITQEVFLALLRRPRAFDSRRGSLESFLYGIARNQVLKNQQRERRYTEIDEDAAAPEPIATDAFAEFHDGEESRVIREVLLSLPPLYREVVVLCELQGLSYAECAALVEVPLGTIRSRLYHARRILAGKLSAVLAPSRGRGASTGRAR